MSNYWPRLIGANILASLLAPNPDPFWLNAAAHVAVVLAVLLVTWPAPQPKGRA